jgi:hypothetical protein
MRHSLRILLILLLNTTFAFAQNPLRQQSWSSDPIWFDGLVEKATYSASRVIYGKPRTFDAVFLTNKEDHDLKTLTKSEKSTQTLGVWKHNQIEVIPTPNYDYKFEATSHLTADGLLLTRLDVASQEFCGTSFKQYQLQGDAKRSKDASWDYFGFSYMPESGRVTAKIEPSPLATVPFNALPLWLRDFDYAAGKEVSFRMLPDQKSNRDTPAQPVDALVRPAGESDATYKVDLVVNGKPIGQFEFAKDRLHVMTRYEAADGSLKYVLKTQERVNYWTITGE